MSPARWLPPVSLRLRPTRPELLLAAAAVALVFASLWSQSRVDRLRLHLAAEGEHHQLLRSHVEFLAKDLSRSSGVREVEGRAAAELGLATPSPENVLILRFAPGEPDREPSRFDVVPEAYAEGRGAGTGR